MSDEISNQEFDEFSDNYQGILDESVKFTGEDSDYYNRYKVEIVSEKEEVGQPLNILDFGCGTGNSLRHFSSYFPNSKLFGVDISSKSIDVARELNIPNSTFDVLKESVLPFDDEAFDIVFSSMVFHHIKPDQYSAYLNEIRRVLKSNGKLYIFEHNPRNLLTRYVVDKCVFDKDAILISAKELVRNIEKCGLTADLVNYTLFIPRFGILKKVAGIDKILRKVPYGGQYFVKSVKKE